MGIIGADWDTEAPAKGLNKVKWTKFSEMLSEKFKRCWTLLSDVERCWEMLSDVERCWVMLSGVERCWALLRDVERCWAMLNVVVRCCPLLSAVEGCLVKFELGQKCWVNRVELLLFWGVVECCSVVWPGHEICAFSFIVKIADSQNSPDVYNF